MYVRMLMDKAKQQKSDAKRFGAEKRSRGRRVCDSSAEQRSVRETNPVREQTLSERCAMRNKLLLLVA